jgi:hypothetical protein
MARRTGIPTLHNVAMRLCSLLARYSSVITTLYPNNATLLAALAAASAACSTLTNELAKVREYGD